MICSKESNLTVDTGVLYSVGIDAAGVMEESAAEDGAAGTGSSGAARQDTLRSSGSGETTKATAVESAEASADYSETNVREQGVDEADIVKTDGTYAYVVSSGSNQVNIIRLADLTACGRVTAENGGRIQEIYVENGRLTLLTQVETTALTRRAGVAAGSAGVQDSDGSISGGTTGITDQDIQETPQVDVIYGSDYQTECRLTVYDISDPALSGEAWRHFPGGQLPDFPHGGRLCIRVYRLLEGFFRGY